LHNKKPLRKRGGFFVSGWLLTFFEVHRIVKSFVASSGIDRTGEKGFFSIEYDPSQALFSRPLL